MEPLCTNRNNMKIVSILFTLLAIRTSNAIIESDFLTHYDLKVEQSEATCRLVTHANLPEDRRTLSGRDCMCDEECVEYKDCCQDSRYYRPNEQSYPSPYHCHETTAVYLKAACSSTWNDDEMAQLCTSSVQPLKSGDVSILLPVANQKTRITYGNRHCAMCNYDQDESNWIHFPLGVDCAEAPAGYLKQPPVPYPSNEFDRDSQITSNRIVTSNDIESENDHCNNANSKITNNNVAGRLLPGFILDINLYVTNHSSIGILNGDNASRWPLNLQNENNFLNYRKKRHSDSIDFNKYSAQATEICSTARYDSYNNEFVSRYRNKDFICRYRPLLPDNSENYTRTCVPLLENKCPDDFQNEIIKKECATYTKIVYNKQSKKPYRNKDCARCNGEKEDAVNGKPLGRSIAAPSEAPKSEGVNSAPTQYHVPAKK